MLRSSGIMLLSYGDAVEHISSILQTTGDFLIKTKENPAAAIFAVAILLSLLGYLLFKADKSHYRAMVFLIVAVMGAFIMFVNYEATGGTPSRQQRVELVRVDLPSVPYGEGLWLGMSEEELRNNATRVSQLKKPKSPKPLGNYVIGRVDLLEGRSTEPLDRLSSMRYAMKEGHLVGVHVSYNCLGLFEEGGCEERCDELEDISENGFSPERISPQWESINDLSDFQKANYRGEGYVSIASKETTGDGTCTFTNAIFSTSVLIEQSD